MEGRKRINCSGHLRPWIALVCVTQVWVANGEMPSPPEGHDNKSKSKASRSKPPSQPARDSLFENTDFLSLDGCGTDRQGSADKEISLQSLSRWVGELAFDLAPREKSPDFKNPGRIAELTGDELVRRLEDDLVAKLMAEAKTINPPPRHPIGNEARKALRDAWSDSKEFKTLSDPIKTKLGESIRRVTTLADEEARLEFVLSDLTRQTSNERDPASLEKLRAEIQRQEARLRETAEALFEAMEQRNELDRTLQALANAQYDDDEYEFGKRESFRDGIERFAKEHPALIRSAKAEQKEQGARDRQESAHQSECSAWFGRAASGLLALGQLRAITSKQVKLLVRHHGQSIPGDRVSVFFFQSEQKGSSFAAIELVSEGDKVERPETAFAKIFCKKAPDPQQQSIRLFRRSRDFLRRKFPERPICDGFGSPPGPI